MKKIILTTVLIMLFFVSYCQVDYEKYVMTQFQNKEYDIKYTVKNKLLDEIYLFGQSLDHADQNIVLVIKAKDLIGFVNYLNSLKGKYSEWKKTAEDNNVTELNKDIPVVNKDKYSVIWEYSNYYIDRNVKLKSKFSIDNGVSVLYIYTGNVYSSTNSYINNSGLIIALNSVEEIDELVEKLNISKIQSFIDEAQNKGALFQ